MSEGVPTPDAGAADVDLITLNETAKLLEKPVEDVFRAVMCGRLPVVWVGPRPYVDRAALSFGSQESLGDVS